EQQDWDVEFVVRDIPAFGWKRVRLTRSAEHAETIDDGREIAADDVSVSAAEDGSLNVRFGDRTYEGLGAFGDTGDRGDTYDDVRRRPAVDAKTGRLRLDSPGPHDIPVAGVDQRERAVRRRAGPVRRRGHAGRRHRRDAAARHRLAVAHGSHDATAARRAGPRDTGRTVPAHVRPAHLASAGGRSARGAGRGARPARDGRRR